MAEILVKAVDATHPNTVKNIRNCAKKGDPILAMPDGHSWGEQERNPEKFVIISVPDMPLAEATALCKPLYVEKFDSESQEFYLEMRLFRECCFRETGIKPENIQRFQESHAKGRPYQTTKLDLLTLGMEIKEEVTI